MRHGAQRPARTRRSENSSSWDPGARKWPPWHRTRDRALLAGLVGDRSSGPPGSSQFPEAIEDAPGERKGEVHTFAGDLHHVRFALEQGVELHARLISSLPGVPCSQPHDNEVYAVFDVSLSAYPDSEDAMFEHALEQCLDRFAGFVGIAYESSELDILTLYPTPESWARNDREVVCAVYDMNNTQLVGSARDVGR